MKLDKSKIYPIVLIVLMFVVYKYRENQNNQLQYLEGETMGTTYHIKYLGKNDYKDAIDSLLGEVNMSMSTYIPESEISRLNQTGKLIIKSSYFIPVLLKSKEVYAQTNGAFDPTVMPLVNAWGFGFKNKSNIDSSTIDSLLQYVCFDSLDHNLNEVNMNKEGAMLDFSAIAKGYGVDVIADFLRSKKRYNFMIEIGGEVACSGVNEEDNVWKIGIDNPKAAEQGSNLSAAVQLQNKALATSGNYRNFYVDNSGVKRAHTINPKTGYPVNHSLLSASVIADNCMTADAYATALMVVGLHESKRMVQQINDIEAFLIFDNNGTLETWASNGFFQYEKN